VFARRLCGDAPSRNGPGRSTVRPTPRRPWALQGCLGAQIPSSHTSVQQSLALTHLAPMSRHTPMPGGLITPGPEVVDSEHANRTISRKTARPHRTADWTIIAPNQAIAVPIPNTGTAPATESARYCAAGEWRSGEFPSAGSGKFPMAPASVLLEIATFGPRCRLARPMLARSALMKEPRSAARQPAHSRSLPNRAAPQLAIAQGL
jgi:hypothetical protein